MHKSGARHAFRGKKQLKLLLTKCSEWIGTQYKAQSNLWEANPSINFVWLRVDQIDNSSIREYHITLTMQQVPYTTMFFFVSKELCCGTNNEEQEEGSTGFDLFICLFDLPCTTSIKNDLTHKNSKQRMMKSIIVCVTIPLPLQPCTQMHPPTNLILRLPQPVYYADKVVA